MAEEQWFPIQGDILRDRDSTGALLRRPAGRVPWGIAVEAFKVYHRDYPGQSLERLAERGGFGWSELIGFLRDDDPIRTIPAGVPM